MVIHDLPTNDQIENLENRIDSLEKITNQYSNFEDIKKFYPDINIEVNAYEKEPNYGSAPINVTKQSIFYDIEGVSYVSDELIGQIILLSYAEGDKEVYFLGTYNENYHWDGYCVTNSYNADGTLYGICESQFDNGERINYISFYKEGDDFIYGNRQKKAICTKE